MQLAIMILTQSKTIDETNTFNIALTGAQALIAFLSLIFVICVFIHDREQRKKQTLYEFNLRWFSLLDLDERLRKLDNIINIVCDYSREIQNTPKTSINSAEYDNVLDQVVEFSSEERNKIKTICSIIDEDKTNEILVKYSTLREELNNLLQGCYNKSLKGRELTDKNVLIESLQNDILKLTHNFGYYHLDSNGTKYVSKK